jgi:WD40 repeat protein
LDVFPDGKALVYVKDGSVRFCEVATGDELKGRVAPPNEVWSCPRFSRDGKRLFVHSKDGPMLWDPLAGRAVHKLPNRVPFGRAAFSPDGTTLAGLGNGSVFVWDLSKGGLHPACDSGASHTGQVNAVAVSPDLRWIASGSDSDDTVRLWEAGTGRLVWSRPSVQLIHDALAFAPGDRTLFAGTSKAVVALDVADGRERQRYPLDPNDQPLAHFHLLRM